MIGMSGYPCSQPRRVDAPSENRWNGFLARRYAVGSLAEGRHGDLPFASQTKPLSGSPRFELGRMRNTNRRKTAGIAIPATRFAAYFVQPATDSIFRLDPFGGIFSKDFESPADDTMKSKDVPLRLF